MNMSKWAFILVAVFFVFPVLLFAAADKDHFVGVYYSTHGTSQISTEAIQRDALRWYIT